MATTKRPLDAGRHPDPGPQPDELASLIVARLYAEGVPVAGIDRLHLHKPLAVKDLLAAIGFAVQPLDDLNLANLLVSPLIGWTQDQLYELAYGRQGKLWTELATRREEQPHWAEAHAILARLAGDGRLCHAGPFPRDHPVRPARRPPQVASALGRGGARPDRGAVSPARWRSSRRRSPSLDRFLAWFGQGEVEIKRDPSAPSNAVRVMTVHGAKGLEAPLVLLADATHDPDKVGGHLVDLRRADARRRRSSADPPAQGRMRADFQIADRRSQGGRPGGALAACLCRADPRRRAAGDRRGQAEARTCRR